MLLPLTTAAGKVIRRAALARGGGSAFPGLFVERIDPSYVRKVLTTLPRGVVVVSGTNGKTTTTKIVVDLLESQGLRVFTNRTGSNFVRGVAAALLGAVNLRGKLDADIAVLELDEAHAVHFVKDIEPTYSLLLNVMRDQLDRFGEIDNTARMLQTIARATTQVVVVNRDDPRLGAKTFAEGIQAPALRSYGTSAELSASFPSDDNMYGGSEGAPKSVPAVYVDDTQLDSFQGDQAEISYGGEIVSTRLQLTGVYNVLNATAGIALTRAVMGQELREPAMLEALSRVQPAFGRGETMQIGGHSCAMVLVKNPGGFRLALSSYDPADTATMIAINDNYADGRDMSWLWDVDFSSLRPGGVTTLAGVRAYDMALRLQYDDVTVGDVIPELEDAVETFLAACVDRDMRIYCTYTAMLAIRKVLGTKGALQKVIA
ncbi:MAG: MurT ligase domain-containing protein [Allobranchiibius sp.]